MKTLAARIIHLRQSLGWDQVRLAAEASRYAGKQISKQVISHLEKGDTDDPKAKTILGLSKALRTSDYWLLTGKGPIETGPEAGGTHVAEPVTLSYSNARPGYIRLPLLVMEAGMGFGTETADPPEVVDYLDIAEWWADLNLPRPHSRIKIITGRGDSNAPLINHGDIVFVDTYANAFDGEGLYVFNWSGRALIKRLALNMRGQSLRIISANPAYPTEEISMAELDQLFISGRVVAWYSLRRN